MRRILALTYHELPPLCKRSSRAFRQFKAALMCHPNSTWLQALPLVLLGIRTAYKEELKCSTAELVYGEPLSLPGEFFSPGPTNSPPTNPDDFVDGLRMHMARLRPTATSNHALTDTFVHKDLANCTHVYLRDDSVRGALVPPYTGPYKIVSRPDDKTIIINIKTADVRVSINRVKPAHIFMEEALRHTTPAGLMV
jgi:hypothetical protein